MSSNVPLSLNASRLNDCKVASLSHARASFSLDLDSLVFPAAWFANKTRDFGVRIFC